MGFELKRRTAGRLKIICVVAAVAMSLLLTSLSSAAPQKKGLLEELGLPMVPGAKLLDEINIPFGKLLEELAKEVVGQFGIEELKGLNVLTLSIDKSTEDVFRLYDPAFAEQQWKTVARSVGRDDEGTGLFFNDKKGLLLMVITGDKSDDREMTVIRMQGKINPAKFGSNNKEISDDLRKMLGGMLPETDTSDVKSAARIPIDRPISVPPSEKLVIKATKSDIAATVFDQNTAEVRLAARKGTPESGELVRVDDLLVLSLTPKLPVEEIDLPGTVPIAFELTDGSLTLSAGPKPADKPSRLSIVSTNAPITLEDFPLVSGTHMVKALGSELSLDFSKVQAGEFVISSTGDDVTLMLPKDASAKIDIDVADGKIQKLIPTDSMALDEPNHMVFQLGAGKAQIVVHAVKGNVCIKPAE